MPSQDRPNDNGEDNSNEDNDALREENIQLRAEAAEVDRNLEAAQNMTRRLQEELEAKEAEVQLLRNKVQQQRENRKNKWFKFEFGLV